MFNRVAPYNGNFPPYITFGFLIHVHIRVLTPEEREADIKVRVYSGENVSIVVPPSTLFKDIAGQDKAVLLRLEDN